MTHSGLHGLLVVAAGIALSALATGAAAQATTGPRTALRVWCEQGKGLDHVVTSFSATSAR